MFNVSADASVPADTCFLMQDAEKAGGYDTKNIRSLCFVRAKCYGRASTPVGRGERGLTATIPGQLVGNHRREADKADAPIADAGPIRNSDKHDCHRSASHTINRRHRVSHFYLLKEASLTAGAPCQSRYEYETLCGRVYKLEEDAFRQEELLSELCQAVSYLAQIVLKTEPTRLKRR
jgi:hypothetical protein